MFSVKTQERFTTAVVFYYDFILTFPQEIKHLWSFKLKPVNVLTMTLWYITALGYIPVFVFAFAPVIDVGEGETVRDLRYGSDKNNE